MAWQVIWTEAGWNDLDEVASYIEKDSPHYAAAFVSEIRDAARSLTQFAARGRIVPEFRQESVRELLVGNYRLVYQVGESTVHILGIIHGARDLGALWERQGRLPSL